MKSRGSAETATVLWASIRSKTRWSCLHSLHTVIRCVAAHLIVSAPARRESGPISGDHCAGFPSALAQATSSTQLRLQLDVSKGSETPPKLRLARLERAWSSDLQEVSPR